MPGPGATRALWIKGCTSKVRSALWTNFHNFSVKSAVYGSQFSIWTGFPSSCGNVSILMELVGEDEYFRQDLAICGRVVEGMDIVAQIEKFGSKSGSTSKRIVIDDCGEVD